MERTKDVDMDLKSIKKINKAIRKQIEEIEPQLISEKRTCDGWTTKEYEKLQTKYDAQTEKIEKMLNEIDLCCVRATAEDILEDYNNNDYSVNDIDECEFFLKNVH